MISLHCPLTEQTHHIIDEKAVAKMKEHCYIINTSRGGLIDSKALLDALRERRIGGAGLDVYEEEAEFFFEDHSEKGITDATLALLSAMPNVLITSHQAFFTEGFRAGAKLMMELLGENRKENTTNIKK